MSKGLLFIRSNLRRSKGQTVAIGILILIAAIMLNMWLMLSFDYKKNFERCHDALNDAHVSLAAEDAADVNEVESFIKSDPRTDEYCISEARVSVASIPYGEGTVNSCFIFMDRQEAESRKVGRVEIVEEDKSVDGVYIPLLYKTDDTAIGKTIKITIYSAVAEYKVAGYLNSAMAGSHNCAMMAVAFSPSAYADFCARDYAPASHFYSVRLSDSDDSDSFAAALSDKVSRAFPGTYAVTNEYNSVLSARYVTQGICSAVVSIMAFLVLVIALIVLFSNIVNYVQVNMKKLGAMKTLGYTSRQIITALVVQFLIISAAAALLGIALSYLAFPMLNGIMVAQTGIPYAMRFLFGPAILTVIIPCAAVSLAVFLAVIRIRRIEPVVAVRVGGSGGGVKNVLPLDKSRLPVNAALALKTALSGIKQNVTVFFTMVVLSLVVVFSAMMTTNIIGDSASFLDMLVGESADAAITVNVSTADMLLDDLNAHPAVEKAYMFTSYPVRHKGGSELTATVSDDCSAINNRKMVVKGEFPAAADEIAIGIKYAKENDLGVGDDIVISALGKEATYRICGLTQLTNQLGKDCLMTLSGYERLGQLSEVMYYIDLVEGTDIDAFNKSFEDNSNYVNLMTFNVDEIVTGAMSVYVSLMKIIVVAIILIAVLVITFVLYLLVRTLLNNRKRDYGIMKSLGFTTKQLVVQTALSFMPAVIVSAAVGILLGCLIMNPMMSLFLAAVGIIESSFTVPVGLCIGMGAGMAVLSFWIACLLSVKVRKITPRELLLGE